MTYYEWRYVVEQELGPGVWRTINSYTDKDHAIKEATNIEGKARVRQFKTTVYQEYRQAKTKATIQDNGETKTVRFWCPSHPDNKVKAIKKSKPKCPDCKLEMIRSEMVTI